jgi:hypothetical protein
MSMPIVATVAVDLLDMAVLLQLPARPSLTRGGAGARPDHSISGHQIGRAENTSAQIGQCTGWSDFGTRPSFESKRIGG